MLKKNQRGFSVVEIIIAIVLVGLLSFAGWFVWNKNHESKKSSSAGSHATTATPTPTPAPCPTGYTEYRNTTYGIKFCYPTTWGTVSTRQDSEMRWGHVTAGSGLEIDFSANTKVTAVIRSQDWTHDPNMGHGGSDSSLSFSPTQEDISSYFSGRMDYDVIATTADEFLALTPLCNESGCSGMGLALSKTVSDNSHTYGIGFVYDAGVDIDVQGPEYTQADIDALDWATNFPSALITQFETVSGTIANI